MKSRARRLRSAAFAIAAILWTAAAVFFATGPVRAQQSGLSILMKQDDWWSAELVGFLKSRKWEPPYFTARTIRSHPDGWHVALARKALQTPPQTTTLGGFDYRSSDPLIEAGREIFHTYHFGTHRFWDFRRAIDWSTSVATPEEYAGRYGVKRDSEGYFVGLVGVGDPGGAVSYGHSCALCHGATDPNGAIVWGAANHDYDIGAYYDALRSRIKDVELVFLGDAALKALRFQGPGRTDPTMDSWWAPVKVPHLFPLKAFEHGLRSNGDTSNLWLQCYRNLNGDYAVEPEIMEALMAFLLSLEPPTNPRPKGEREKRGEAVFNAQGCGRCHSRPYYTNGRIIDWETIRTDYDRIRNGWPKGYKVPSLRRLDMMKLYLHDGSLTSLDQLFDPSRLTPGFIAPGIPAGRRRSGAGVPGHPYGLGLPPEDRAALVAFLGTL